MVIEESVKTPVIAEADICVVGGSCTGLFAAVRAARLGAKVILIERHGFLGGTATAGLVNIWHSLFDADGKEQIISGLTEETLCRLGMINAKTGEGLKNPHYSFNPNNLKAELDRYIKESKIELLLHTVFSGVIGDGKTISAITVENDDGRGAVRARFFIDATGTGKLSKNAGLQYYTYSKLQPPTSCFILEGDTKGLDLKSLIEEHAHKVGLVNGWGWSNKISGCDNLFMRADTHVYDNDCLTAKNLTAAEVDGREQMKAFVSLLRQYANNGVNYSVASVCTHIGIRDGLHFESERKADELSLLTGMGYADTVAKGTYPIDIHFSEGKGITFKYLSGKKSTIYGAEGRREDGSWMEDIGYKGEPAKYYQLSYRTLVNTSIGNLIAVGRMINADEGAFGALRVMVNLNQMGEAAGVAAYLAVSQGVSADMIDAKKLVNTLRSGGSAL